MWASLRHPALRLPRVPSCSHTGPSWPTACSEERHAERGMSANGRCSVFCSGFLSVVLGLVAYVHRALSLHHGSVSSPQRCVRQGFSSVGAHMGTCSLFTCTRTSTLVGLSRNQKLLQRAVASRQFGSKQLDTRRDTSYHLI